jgi:hypothetical protein
MQVQMTRDSVAAGDDADAPHSYQLDVAENATLSEILQLVASKKHLPAISGGRATWSVNSQKSLAVMAQQWYNPKLYFQLKPHDGWLMRDQALQLHFTYHAQQDPEQVYNLLRDLCFL